MFSITRYLTGVAVLCIATASVAQAGELEIKVGNVEATAGGEVEVPITVKGGKGVEGLQFVLTFDDKVLKHESVDAGEIAGAADVDAKERETGAVRVAMIPEKTIDSDGQLLVAKFKVLGESGSKSAIELSEVRAWEFGSEAPLEMLVSAESGEVTVIGKGLPVNLTAIIVGAVALLLLLLLIARRGGGKAPANS